MTQIFEDYVNNLNVDDKVKNYMRNIQNVKNELQTGSKRTYISILPEIFKEMFIAECEIEILKKYIKKDFIVDDTNKDTINQLYFYLIGSDKFIGDLKKGILLIGSIGTGKTTMINALLNIIEGMGGKRFLRLHAKKLSSILKKDSEKNIFQRPCFVDDIGKESAEENDYGTKIFPIVDLFTFRYDFGAWTFGTSNYNEETLTDFYGVAIYDRFKEIFNILTIIGESKRT